MSAFQSPLDLAALTVSTGIGIAGTSSNDRTGYFLASAGDVNGDGFSDLIMGMDPQTSPAGGVVYGYVVFGKASGWSHIDLANLGGNGFRIAVQPYEGPPTYGTISVSTAGDVNDDGYDDLLVGSRSADSPGRGNNGASWIIYGKPSGWATVDLQQPLGSAGARVNGAAGGDYTGRTVATAGDVNGDGFDDVVVGGQFYASYGPGSFAGSTFIVFGGAGGIPNLDLASPGAAAWRIDGAPGDNIGRTVAMAGDLNGDGLADIITAGLTTTPAQAPSIASAFVVFGKTGGFGTLNLADLGSGGFRINGIAPSSVGEISVGSAGDFNGDGFTDLIIGAPGASNNGRTGSGSAYLIYGRAGGFNDIDLNNPGSYGFRIDGAAQYNYTGQSVAGAGDVNGDGYADILIGAYGAGNNNRFFSGSTTVILGRPGGSSNIDLANLGSAGFRVDGAAASDRSGRVAGAGDADGDGFADILIGAFTADPLGRTDAGAAYLLFSQSQGGATYRGTTLADILRGTPDGDNLNGYGQNDHLYGMAGSDTLTGGTGNDTLDGGPGNDNMAGGAGDDTYLLDDQADAITEQNGEGADTAWITAAGAINIGQNVEIIRLSGAATQVNGSGSDEQIVANAALVSTITGGGGDDVLWGGSLAHTLQGGEGDDVIRGQDGAGTFIGGQGNDQFVIANAAAVVVENANDGTDTVWVTANDHTLAANIEIVRLAGTAFRLIGSTSAEQLVANPNFASIIDARGGNDVLWGSNFGDLLNGDNGDDILRGGFGADTLFGGIGNDQFVVTDNAAILMEAQSEGDDTAWIAVQGYVVGENIERINLSGVANTAIGNASDNIIAGNPLMANDYLVGGGGSDTIFGSIFADAFRGDAGNDTLYSLGGADRFIYSAPGWGYDAINGFTQGQARLDFTGSGIAFSQLAIQYANGNAQIEFGGSAILLFNMGNLTAGDFLF